MCRVFVCSRQNQRRNWDLDEKAIERLLFIEFYHKRRSEASSECRGDKSELARPNNFFFLVDFQWIVRNLENGMPISAEVYKISRAWSDLGLGWRMWRWCNHTLMHRKGNVCVGKFASSTLQSGQHGNLDDCKDRWPSVSCTILCPACLTRS